MPIDTYQPYDYIVIGAGTAGSVIASRISENQHVSVAVLEAGGENTNDVSRAPGAFFKVWGTDYDWQYNSTPQTGLNGRTIYQPRGKVIGGSSAINVGAWLRGTKADYEWEELGAVGWNFNEALRMFTSKIEDTNRGPTEYRGSGGMMYMSDAVQPDDTVDKQVQAFAEVGFGPRGDISGKDPYKADVYQIIYKDFVRRSVGDAYLSDEVRGRENLSVITNAFVTKILFNEDRHATGVEFIKNGQPYTMRANKEIILSAGAYNTPKLLKLSGVGPEAELTSHGIALVADVPGVGENLHDHIMVRMTVLGPADRTFGIKNGASSTDAAIAQWRADRTGPATYFTGNSAGLISVDDDKNHDPDFELLFGSSQNASNDMPEFEFVNDIQNRSGYTIDIVLLQPESKGNVLLASNDAFASPVINPNYLTDPRDINKFVKGVKKVMQIFGATALQPITSLIHISPQSTDAQIEEFIRRESGTTFHPIGTARIGDLSDLMVVVDSDLKVRGVTGLRVADASILPRLNRGHTMAPTVYIGEMAAEKIIKDM